MIPEMTYLLQAQLRGYLGEHAQGLSGPRGRAAGNVLDDDHRGQEGGCLQVRFPPVSGHQDTARGGGPLPNFVLWKQIIDEVRPKLVITTGRAGASASSSNWATWSSVRLCGLIAGTG